MFDLLEEDLTTKTPEQPVVLRERPAPVSDPIVYAMPQKFRVAPKKSSPAVLVALIGGGALVMSTIFLGIVFLSKPPQDAAPVAVLPESTLEEPSVPAAVATSSLDVLSTSTQSTLDSPSVIATSTDSVIEKAASPSSPETTPVQPPEEIQSTAPIYEPGVDTDSDFLTDAEERLFGTNPEKPDTDEDGYLDGNEFRSGFDPLRADKSTLDTAKYISRYANETFAYSFLHPQLWIAKPVDPKTELEVLLSSATGEFISLSAKENPKKLPLSEWVSEFAPNFNQGPLSTSAEGVVILEAGSGLEAYALQTDASGAVMSPLVLHIKYELNTKQELNFLSTFQMLVRSIRFKGASQ